MIPTTSLTLLDRIKNSNDQDAWFRLHAIYYPTLVWWAVKKGLDESEANDLAQSVFLKLVREVPTFQYSPEKGKFRSWLYAISMNHLRDMQRKKRPENPGSTMLRKLEPWDSGTLTPLHEEEFYSHFVQKALQVMADSFEEKTWRACWETTVNGRSAKEVAMELGMAEGSVFVAKGRVLRKLREELVGLLE